MTFQELTSSTDYKAASFELQAKTRQAWVKRDLLTNSDFKLLKPEDQKATINAALFAPPSFEDPQVDAFSKDLLGKVQAGDKNAKSLMEKVVINQVRKDNSVIYNIADKILTSDIVQGAIGDQLENLGIIPKELSQSSEAKKMIAHFGNFLDRTSPDASGLNTLKTIAAISGTLVDFASISNMVGTSVEGAKGVGMFAKFVDEGIRSSVGKTSGLVLGRMVGEGVHAGITSMLGVAREFAREALVEEATGNQDFQTILSKSARWFGEYFAMDLAVNWATGVLWPMVKIGAKGGIKGYGDIATIYKNLNPTEFKEMQHLVFSGADIPQDMLTRLPKELQQDVVSDVVTFRVLKNIEKITDEGAMQLIASKNNFSLIKKGDSLWEISSKTGDKTTHTVKSLQEISNHMVKVITKGQMNPIFAKATIEEFSKRAASSQNLNIKAIIKGEIPLKYSKDINILTRLASPVDGKFSKSKLEAFSKTFVRGGGGGDEVIKGIKVIDEDGMFKIYSKEGLLSEIPKGTLKATDETLAISNLTKKLSELTTGKEAIPVGGNFIEAYSKSLIKQNLFTPEWMAYAINRSGGVLIKAGDNWTITSKINPSIKSTYKNLNEVGEKLIRENATLNMLKQSAEKRGMRVVGTDKSEILKIMEGRNEIARGKNINELLDQVPEILPKMSSELGPSITLTKTGQLEVRVTKDGLAISNQTQMMKFLDKFASRSFGGKSFSLTGGAKGRIEFSAKRKQFDVVIGEIGERRTFNQVKKAREYLEGGWKEMENLEISANKKGYRMEYKVSKWFLYSSEGEKLIFDKFDDVTKALKEVPVPEWAPELSGLPEELLDGFKRPEDDFFRIKEPDLSNSKFEYSILAKAGQIWTPIKSTLERFVKEGGNPIGLKMFNDIEAARLFVVGREGAIRKTISTIFDNGSGKIMKKKVRRWVGEYAEAPDKLKPQIIEDALRDKVKFGTQEINAAEKLRAFYGTTENEGAFAYFGIGKKQVFIKNYLPKIKEYYQTNPGKVFTDGNPHAYLASIFDNKTPRELDAFFKHARTSDIVDIALEKDPMAQLYRYTNIGLKEKYLGELIEKVKTSPTLALDRTMQKRMFNYLAQIGGLPQGNAQEIIRSITPQILSKFGISPQLTNDITSWFMSLGYSASMGFKPWLPVRNMNQIWTTLAMRMQDNGWVKKALSDVAGPEGGAIFDALRKKGSIMSALPLFGSEVIDQNALLGKITHTSLKMYKNSDDFTRAVAYQAASLKFDDAFKRIKSIGLSPDEFGHMSGVSQMDPTTRNAIFKLMNEGKINGAKDMFASEIVTETMFPYRSGMAPLAFSGTLGKMFGMMGHYPAYYVDNIRRGIKYMNTGEKIVAGSIMAGNSLALYGAFRAIGVRADNFKPWEPAIFTGGPAWEIMQDTLSAVGGGFEGKQARAKLLGLSNKNGKLEFNPTNSTIFKWTVPGAFEIKKMQDAVQLSNEGDTWGAFLSSMGASYNSDWEIMSP